MGKILRKVTERNEANHGKLLFLVAIFNDLIY